MAVEYIALRGSCAAFSRPSCSKFQMHLSFLVSDAHQHITPSNHQRFCNLHKKGLAWHLGLGENFSLHTYLAICTAKCNETDSWAISYKLKWIEYPRVTSHMSLFFSSLGSSFVGLTCSVSVASLLAFSIVVVALEVVVTVDAVFLP